MSPSTPQPPDNAGTDGRVSPQWPQVSVPHESDLRSMVADSQGTDYRAYKTLQEARSDPDAVVILEGDWGGMIYVVAPLNLVRCDEDRLRQLLVDLDVVAWGPPDGQEEGGRDLLYEHQPVGSGIPGGMGGAASTGELWVHQELVRLGIQDSIARVLSGELDRIPPTEPRRPKL